MCGVCTMFLQESVFFNAIGFDLGGGGGERGIFCNCVDDIRMGRKCRGFKCGWRHHCLQYY